MNFVFSNACACAVSCACVKEQAAEELVGCERGSDQQGLRFFVSGSAREGDFHNIVEQTSR